MYFPHAYPDRTHESAAEVAQVTGHAVDGIEGVSPLAGYVCRLSALSSNRLHAHRFGGCCGLAHEVLVQFQSTP